MALSALEELKQMHARIAQAMPIPTPLVDTSPIVSSTLVSDFFNATPAQEDPRPCLIGPPANLYYCACHMVDPMTDQFAALALAAVEEAGAYAAGEKRSRIGHAEAREELSRLCEVWEVMQGEWVDSLPVGVEIDPFAAEEEKVTYA